MSPVIRIIQELAHNVVAWYVLALSGSLTLFLWPTSVAAADPNDREPPQLSQITRACGNPIKVLESWRESSIHVAKKSNR